MCSNSDDSCKIRDQIETEAMMRLWERGWLLGTFFWNTGRYFYESWKYLTSLYTNHLNWSIFKGREHKYRGGTNLGGDFGPLKSLDLRFVIFWTGSKILSDYLKNNNGNICWYFWSSIANLIIIGFNNWHIKQWPCLLNISYFQVLWLTAGSRI